MLIKEDFLREIRNVISQYPAAVLLYQVGDARLLSSLEAMATMLSMVSQQVEVAMEEPFSKARDATVLADASLKGILPMARPAGVRISVQNVTATPYTLQAGRRLIDSNGRLFTVDTAVVVAPGATATATALQRTVRTITHTVEVSEPFYRIELPASTEDKFIAGLAITRVSDSVPFTYNPDFCNVDPGDLIYSMETDEYRRLYVRFGFVDVVGYQPSTGEQFTLDISECDGDVRPDQGSPFTLEYTLSPQDTQVVLKMDALLQAGAEPIDMTSLRELTRYPSVYTDNAVFLGEFDFLIRRRIPGLRFLSVWNEQIEEKVRPPSVDNINVLFVSVLPELGGTLMATQDAIREVVRRADDSYDIKFVTPIDRPIVVNVEAIVSIVTDPAVVASQINQSLIREYGETTPAARRGMVVTQYNRIYDRLRTEVAALTDKISDLRVSIVETTDPILPENRRFISQTSAVITVTPVKQNLGNWGA